MTSSAELVELLVERNLRVAVAESLTGGLLMSELITAPGASRVILGGVVAYHTQLKLSLLGVDADVLNVHGAVHPDVAIQMAVRVRDLMPVDGLPAEVGIRAGDAGRPDPGNGLPGHRDWGGCSRQGALAGWRPERHPPAGRGARDAGAP